MAVFKFGVVPVGPDAGLAQLPGCCYENILSFPARFKSKDYMAEMINEKNVRATMQDVAEANAAYIAAAPMAAPKSSGCAVM